MSIRELIETLHPLERRVLPVLKEDIELKEIIEKTKLKDVEVVRALQWFQNKDVLKIKQELKEVINLDKNGLLYLKEGLPETRFLKSLTKELDFNEVKDKAGLTEEEFNISLGLLKKNDLISIKNGKIKITEKRKKSLNESKEEFLKKLPLETKELGKYKKIYEELKSRKQIIKKDVIKLRFVKLTELGKKLIKEKISNDFIDSLTTEILKNNSWRNKKFRRYDIKINVPKIYPGKRHFVNQATNYIKRIWLDMGFKEMTGNIIQTSFWHLDALFVPQDHPARDMQDTFYIKEPKYGLLPKELMKKVKLTHENGYNTNSKGWQYSWSIDLAKENLLRTHTTVLSAQTIAKLKKEDLPAKFFSVGKVYRNETLSWKSLFEFIQVEGIVVDPEANFMNLKGYLKEFFAKMGFPNVRIRPAHFPYTEPSAEVDVWHPVKKQWVELGGSGIFRPEMVKPLLGFDCPVLAWGIGMERTIMEYYKFKDIRDIYKNDLKQLREAKLWIK